MQAKYRALREGAYQEGRRTFAALDEDPRFRDFVTLYIAEGYKRDRNKVVLGNSDPAVVAFTDAWLGRLSTGSRTYSLQYHADQDPAACARFGDASSGSRVKRSASNASPTADSSPAGGGGRSTAC